jgi:hypothetical protein
MDVLGETPNFVLGGCAIGHQAKCLTVIDEFTKEALAIDPGAC